MILSIRIAIFEVGMLIEAVPDTQAELHKRWAIAHRAYQRALYESEFCVVPRRIKADLKWCKKILIETQEFL